MKKLLISLAILVMVGSLYAATVTDNPMGGLYPIHLRRSAKSYTVSFAMSQVTVTDTGAGGALDRVLDTISPQGRRFVWRAPHDCKVDSFYVACGEEDSLLAADSMLVTIIGNNSGTNGDTIISDTLAGGSATLLNTPIKLNTNLADSAKNKLSATKTLIFKLDPYGSATSSETVYFFEFTVVPVDR